MIKTLQHRRPAFAKRTRTMCAALGFALLLGVIATPSGHTQTLTTLYSFTGNSDGLRPYATPLLDGSGNIQGTTPLGGAWGLGTVFELSPQGQETVQYSFAGAPDGQYPRGPLIEDGSGNRYGTTLGGGQYGFGTVFMLDNTGTESVLYNFPGVKNGKYPYAGLVQDPSGELYGSTCLGGAAAAGVLFSLNPSTGVEKVLYSFGGTPDGACPYAGLLLDASGDLYGTTFVGGAYGYGTVFELNTNGTETVLYSFTGGADGGTPSGALTWDSLGNLYGTTFAGGASNTGVVFSLNLTTGVETVVHSFAYSPDGGHPYGTLVWDASGNLYGTTFGGGSYGFGTVFEVDSGGNETVLYSFSGGVDGGTPYTELVWDSSGNLYGTTAMGGVHDAGTVFELAP